MLFPKFLKKPFQKTREINLVAQYDKFHITLSARKPVKWGCDTTKNHIVTWYKEGFFIQSRSQSPRSSVRGIVELSEKAQKNAQNALLSDPVH